MKYKIFIAAIVMFFFLRTHATIRTVCNYPVNVAQYNDIQSAINASGNGDTILVQGSPVTYEPAIVDDKRLTLIGPGWSPVRLVSPLTAKVKRITINGIPSSGTEIQGFVFTEGSYYGIITEQNQPVNDIRVIRNYFLGIGFSVSDGFGNGNGTTCKGYVVEGNYFETATFYIEVNNKFENSVIQNNIFYNSVMIGFQLCNAVLVNHNLFYRNGINGSSTAFEACENLSIQNNIFSRSDPGGVNITSNCYFRNNLTYNTSTIAAWTINGNGDDGGNILNQNHQMADQVIINSTAGGANPLLDFTIATGPANNSASDGKDMGLLFDATGSLNWTYSRNSRLPYVYKVSIANNTIEPNATLNVSLEARKTN